MRGESMNVLCCNQVADLAGEIATASMAIERLSRMVDACNDPRDRCAMTVGIESIAKHAGAMADLLNVAHGGVPVMGDFNAWCTPAFLDRDAGGVGRTERGGSRNCDLAGAQA